MKKIKLIAFLLFSCHLFALDSLKSNSFNNENISNKIKNKPSSYQSKKYKSISTNYTSNDVNLNYKTTNSMGLSIKASLLGEDLINEEHNPNIKKIVTDAIISEAYIQYNNYGFAFTLGRQAVDLEWLSKFNEAAFAEVTALPNTVILFGYTHKQAINSSTTKTFEKIGSKGKKSGIYIVDAKYNGLKIIELNPYFYSASDTLNFYGLKANFISNLFDIEAHYATSSENTHENGSIAHIDIINDYTGLSFGSGFVKTDKDGGLGSIAQIGSTLAPFDSAVNIYSSNAQTIYGSINYKIANTELGILYGKTKFNTNDEESELNVVTKFNINKKLKLSFLYVNYDLKKTNLKDFNSLKTSITYSF